MSVAKSRRSTAKRVAAGGPRPAGSTDVADISAERLPAAVRQSLIASAFKKREYVAVSRLADEFGVSTMTIRRDITTLENKGLLKRTHGGAVAVDLLEAGQSQDKPPRRANGVPASVEAALQMEPPFAARVREHAVQKLAIAKAAAKLIGPSEVIALDVGTSTFLLAQELCERGDLRIVTNNLSAASMLTASSSSLYVLGGQVRCPELSIVGAETIEAAKARYTDKVFLGIAGLHESGGFDFSPEDTLVKQAYASNTAEVIVLCDSSKFNKRAMTRVLELGSIDCIVSDAAPTGALADALERAQVRVIVAERSVS